MSIPVVIEPQAKTDLRQAVKWWAENRSKQQALRWYDGIRDAIATLTDHPQRCVLARENHKSDDELRELHFGLGSRPTHHAAQDDWDVGEK